MKYLAIFAGLVAVDAVKAKAIGHYSKVIKTFEDMYNNRKEEYDALAGSLKSQQCRCDKSAGKDSTTWSDALKDQTYWLSAAESYREQMDALSAKVSASKQAIKDTTDQINSRSDSCQAGQADYVAHYQTMSLQLIKVQDAQTLVAQHLGKHAETLAQTGEKSFLQMDESAVTQVHSEAFNDADARIFTPDLKQMLGELLLTTNVRMPPEQVKNVMAFLQAPTAKIAHAFAQMAAGQKSTTASVTFEGVWDLLQTLINQIKSEMDQNKLDQKLHAQACQNWINIDQVESDADSSDMQKDTNSYNMFTDQYHQAIFNMNAASSIMDNLSGDTSTGGFSALSWSASGWTGSIGRADAVGCATDADTAACFTGVPDTAAPTGTTAGEIASAYNALIAKCQTTEGAAGQYAGCNACGFDLTKRTDGSMQNPQNCFNRKVFCTAGTNSKQDRLDTLKSEMTGLTKAKEIMYQKEAEFDAAARDETAMFFLQEEQSNAPDLKPVVDKIVGLINSEQDKRQSNVDNRADCTTQIQDAENAYKTADSLVQATKDMMASSHDTIKNYMAEHKDQEDMVDDIEAQIQKAWGAHNKTIDRLQSEEGAMQPLIDTLEGTGGVKAVLIADGFTAGDDIIKIVERLIDDLKHEQSQLGQEITDTTLDYNQEHDDLDAQKTLAETRQNDLLAIVSEWQGKLANQREDHSAAKTAAGNSYDDYHTKSVKCNDLMTNFNEIQEKLDAHIGKLTQMLGLFTNMAGLEPATSQLHVSNGAQTYYDGMMSASGSAFDVPTPSEYAGDTQRIDNNGYTATPNALPATGTQPSPLA